MQLVFALSPHASKVTELILYMESLSEPSGFDFEIRVRNHFATKPEVNFKILWKREMEQDIVG